MKEDVLCCCCCCFVDDVIEVRHLWVRYLTSLSDQEKSRQQHEQVAAVCRAKPEKQRASSPSFEVVSF